MVTQPQPPRWTVDTYLDMERGSTVKHEYLDGYVYAMAGGTGRHSRISVNVITLLSLHLRGRVCQVFNSDMRVRIDQSNYVYPDASVSCDARDLEDAIVFLSNPCLVVEVLSDDSTAEYDRGDKFDLLYRRAESIQEYVLVETGRIGVEVRRRRMTEDWARRSYGPGDMVVLESIEGRFAVGDFYR
jgi:Uma2 family endonuclease